MEFFLKGSFFLKSFITLFTIVDPIGGVPLFISITYPYSPEEKIKIAFKSSLTLFITLTLFLITGKALLNVFQISLNSFKIAGGVLLFITGLEMLTGKTGQIKFSSEETKKSLKKEDVSIVPLGIPYLAGPGAITTVIILSNTGHTFLQKFYIFVDIALVSFLTYLVFAQSYRIFKLLGELGTKALVRILGLILTTIAIEYITGGIKGAFFS